MGGNVGKSLVEEDYFSLALEILEKAKAKKVAIHLPVDSLCAKAFSNDIPVNNRSIDTIPNDEMGLDIGPKSINVFEKIIHQSKLVLWNGPMGVFEMSNFQKGTVS